MAVRASSQLPTANRDRSFLLVVAILSLQAAAASFVMRRDSVTVNECAHIPAGLAEWYEGDFSLYNVDPPLPRMLATAPLLLRGNVSLAALRGHDHRQRRPEWPVGHLFSETNRANYHEIVITARLVGLAWLAAGGYLLWRFATELHGRRAGIAALCFWATEPLLNAHGALVTPDLPAAVLSLAAVYILWRRVRQDNIWTTQFALLMSVVLGVAVLAKFTNLLLFLVLALVAATSRIHAGGSALVTWSRRSRVLIGGASGFVLCLWCGYCFDGIGTQLRSFTFRSELFVKALGGEHPFDRGVVAALPSPLPPEMVRGIDVQQVDFERPHDSFLRGMTSRSGWPWYYVYGLGVKLPVGLLFAWAIGSVIATVELARRRLLDYVVVFAPVLVYVGIASLKYSATDHVRYVLPAVPFVILCASRAAEPIEGVPFRLTRVLAPCLIALSAASAWTSYPHWLGYFNELAGGPRRGWWHLEDSNVDWGQDLIFLREWMDANPAARPIAVGSHHWIDTAVYLGDRTCDRWKASYVAVDAFTLVHDDWNLWREEPIDRVGTSFFIFRIRGR
jgi:hypothetical protein